MLLPLYYYDYRYFIEEYLITMNFGSEIFEPNCEIDGITVYPLGSSSRAEVIAAHQVGLARRRRPPSHRLEL